MRCNMLWTSNITLVGKVMDLRVLYLESPTAVYLCTFTQLLLS